MWAAPRGCQSHFLLLCELLGEHSWPRGRRVVRQLWAEVPFSALTCCLVTQSRLTLCDSMDCSMPGFPVHHQLPELLKLISIKLLMPSTISSSVVPFSSCPQSFPASGSFPVSRFFTSGQGIGASASASVLPMDIQGCFPGLIDFDQTRLTGLISLLSKELSRVFFNITFQRHQFFGTHVEAETPILWPPHVKN